MTATDEAPHVLTWDPRAVSTLTAMKEQAVAVHESWKDHRPEWASVGVLTLSRQLVDLMGTGLGHDTKVYRDGELSLLVTTESGLVYGMIFHPKVYRVPAPEEGDVRLGIAAPVMGRFCMAGKQNTGAYCTEPYQSGKRGKASGVVVTEGPTCDCEFPLPTAMPVPGEWTFHS